MEHLTDRELAKYVVIVVVAAAAGYALIGVLGVVTAVSTGGAWVIAWARGRAANRRMNGIERRLDAEQEARGRETHVG